MSIYTALRAGVAGLNANSNALAVISDNVANVNTVGYKRAQTDFTALLNIQNASTTYNAGGVVATERRFINQQGSLEQTLSSTDLAISGQGFFVVGDNALPLSAGGDLGFTRAGSFSQDSEGYLRNAQGFYLQGWPIASDGTVNASPTSLALLEAINLSTVTESAEATDTISVAANLDATTAIDSGYAAGNIALNAAAGSGGTVADFETTVEVFDSLGTSRTLALGFVKTAANTWAVEAYTRPATDSTGVNGLVANGTIAFDSTGAVSGVTGTIASAFTVNWAAASGAAAQPITLDLASGFSQLSNASTVRSIVSDGVSPGTLTGLSVVDGDLTAQFSNGRARALYRLPIANFAAPNELQPDRGGVFRATIPAGPYLFNAEDTAGAGKIVSNVLEASNVDLASEFTTMITTQRAYSASSKIVTTADEMLNELIAIKR